MKKFLVLFLIVLSQGAFAAYDGCHLSLTRTLKVGIFAESVRSSLVPVVDNTDVNSIDGLISTLNNLVANGHCRSLYQMSCEVAQTNHGQVGIYMNGQNFPMIMSQSSHDLAMMGKILNKLKKIGHCE